MTALPPEITGWFDARGWAIHPHQRAMLEAAGKPCQLLIAPTGGGKTMAGFLPTLAELADGTHGGSTRSTSRR
jgi:ATP-dependent helicase Lhr and Lhr-like helicase